jgi:hypothetical protein
MSGLTRDTLLFTHNLDKSDLFSDEALINLIDHYPHEAVEVFTMGYDPTDSTQWFFGRRGKHDGKALMDAVRRGRIWINLRKSNRVSPDINALMEQLFDEVAAFSGVRSIKPDLGLLISSPNAQVFYHLDMPLVLLFQIRGQKRVYLYPPSTPYITEPLLEGLALKENDEQLPFDLAWDKDAFVHDLKPGEMLSWAQNAPHRIVNGDMVNVSLSVEYMTGAGLWRANKLYGNGLLRRWFKVAPSLDNDPKWLDLPKIVLARMIKAFGGFKGHKSPLKPAFTLDENDPAVIHFDAGVRAPTKA